MEDKMKMQGLRIKQTAYYDGKKIPLPFLIAKETLNTKMTKVRNRFGGEETELPEFAVAVYDVIMGSEMLQDWKTHRQGLDWFIKYFPKQYMVLLD
tara:strand:+ start:617 stop:904 length:288 start_codon:yes stop_codon:yes gene_type:complete